MKISQKRTCEGCRALYMIDSFWECHLGYENHYSKGVPLKPCPKPKTWKEYNELQINGGRDKDHGRNLNGGRFGVKIWRKRKS